MMGYWKRFIMWCQRPELIKIRPFNLNLKIGEKHVIKNLLRIGGVIMGFAGFWLFRYPRVEKLFLGMIFSGLGLMGLGIVLQAKKWFNFPRKTLLQVGVAYTIFWIMIYTARIGAPLDSIRYGSASVSIPVLMLGVYPTLGLILLALGIVPKEKTGMKVKSWRGRDVGRWKRFIQWYQRPELIKIRRFSSSIAVVAIAVLQTVSLFVVVPGLFGPLVDISGITIPPNLVAADLLPSEVAGEPFGSGSIVTETLYTVVCTSYFVSEVPAEDIGDIKFQVEYTRAQYNEIVVHVFKAPSSDYSWESQGVLQTLQNDDNWYGGASNFPLALVDGIYTCNWFTARKGGRSTFFFRSGAWVFGVDAENYLARNRFARDLIQHLDAHAPRGMVMLAESGYVAPIIVLIAVILGTSITWGRLLGRISGHVNGVVSFSWLGVVKNKLRFKGGEKN